jgi:hypothetical protein
MNSQALQRITPYIPSKTPKERCRSRSKSRWLLSRPGVCVSANLSIGQFDSHANNDPDQMKLIPEFLAGIAYMMRRAEELNIREKLVIVVQSEMGTHTELQQRQWQGPLVHRVNHVHGPRHPRQSRHRSHRRETIQRSDPPGHTGL